ncbi:MAG: hypothetical protein ACLGQH_02220 [Acidobacteriota bacterium]
MSFAPRLFAIVLLVFVAACTPATRNAAKSSAKSVQATVPAKAAATKPAPSPGPAKTAPPAPQPATSAAPSAPVASAEAAVGSPPQGFGGIAWGAPVGSQPGLAQYEASQETGVVTCLWPQGPKDVVGAPIRDAYYEFFKNQFYHVWINFDGMAAYEKALAGLTRAYGPPTQENRDKYYHAWSLGDVNIYCAFHTDLNEGDVSFFYQPIYERMIAARKAGGAKAPARSAKP